MAKFIFFFELVNCGLTRNNKYRRLSHAIREHVWLMHYIDACTNHSREKVVKSLPSADVMTCAVACHIKSFAEESSKIIILSRYQKTLKTLRAILCTTFELPIMNSTNDCKYPSGSIPGNNIPCIANSFLFEHKSGLPSCTNGDIASSVVPNRKELYARLFFRPRDSFALGNLRSCRRKDLHHIKRVIVVFWKQPNDMHVPEEVKRSY